MIRVIPLMGLLLFFFSFLSADDSEKIFATLVAGPSTEKGLPLLDPNGISYTYGKYDWSGNTVELFFLRQPIDYPVEWTITSCSGMRFLSYTAESFAYIYMVSEVDDNPWFILLRFASGAENLCNFLLPFKNRFEYFEALLKNKRYVTFPAVLEQP